MNRGAFFSDMIQSITERGRRLLSPNARDGRAGNGMEASCETLLSSRGEASGMALAKDILDRWEQFDESEQRDFMMLLLDRFGPDADRLENAIDAYRTDPTPNALRALHAAAEPRRQELIRRLNLAPKGISTLVCMREKLLAFKEDVPDLAAVDADFAHLFTSWFNRGFLVLWPISWSTPADILEKVIRYEAVHHIHDWDELRRRLKPEDRRCFAFFHPQLVDEPLIFVEVALMKEIPENIADVLQEDRAPMRAQDATTAVFYSISNCQAGLRGVSFGNFLIKQVVEDLRRDLPRLNTFVTLSPVPGFAKWLAGERSADQSDFLNAEERERLTVLDEPGWADQPEIVSGLKPVLMTLAGRYFLNARTGNGRIIDPVARFHLGNGARLERINFLADRSPGAMRQAHGLMVNYLYKLDDIETNHEAFAGRGEVAASQAVRRLVPASRRTRSASPASEPQRGGPTSEGAGAKADEELTQ